MIWASNPSSSSSADAPGPGGAWLCAPHGSPWTELLSLAHWSSRRPRPGEILLHGLPGVGKSMLLRQLRHELFNQQDQTAPLLIRIPAGPFRPRAWARRFLMDCVQQWAAFQLRNPRLAEGKRLSPADLMELCHHERMGALAELLEDYQRQAESTAESPFLVEWAFDALADAARQAAQPLLLMIDGAENARWTEEGEAYCLSRCVRPLGEETLCRRVWTARFGQAGAHPLLPPLPNVDEEWELNPLNPTRAREFMHTLAGHWNVEVDDELLADYLALLGGLPRYLRHFLEQARAQARAIERPEQFLALYVNDLRSGATARHFQAELAPPGQTPLDPLLLARLASRRLEWEDELQPALPPRAPRDRDQQADLALARLAGAGLAEYRQGRWHAPRLPVPQDYLTLFIDLHQHGTESPRSELALKRRRLVGSPRLAQGRRAMEQLRQVEAMLSAFQGQSLPEKLFMAQLERTGRSEILDRDAEQQAADESVAGQAAGLHGRGRATRKREITLPRSVGTYRLSAEAQQDLAQAARVSPMPVAVAWCFAAPGYFRSDEILWIAHLSDVSVITTAEVDAIVRCNQRIGRELEVPRSIAWIVSDARYSLEARERIQELGIYCSSWEDFEQIGRRLMQGGDEEEEVPPLTEVRRDYQRAAEPEHGHEPAHDEQADEEPGNSTVFFESSPMGRVTADDKAPEPDGVPDFEAIEDEVFTPPLDGVHEVQSMDGGGEYEESIHQEADDGQEEDWQAPTSDQASDNEEDEIRQREPRIHAERIDNIRDEEIVEIFIPPLENMEMTAARQVEELARRHDYREADIGQMKMATLEATLNAIERSSNAEKEVRVILRALPDRIVIEIENEGMQFDPQSVETPDLEAKLQENYKRGWGLKLIQQFMDRVVFEPYAHGTRLRMEKYRLPDLEQIDDADAQGSGA